MQSDLRQKADLFKDIESLLIDFYPDQMYCAIHGVRLLVLKTDTREARSTLYPSFWARRIYLYCPLCKLEHEQTVSTTWKHTPQIPLLTRGKSPFSMDVVAHVGRSKFLGCKRRDEIQEDLEMTFGFHSSVGTLSAMGMEFLVRLKCLHEIRFGRIEKAIKNGGGYIIGIDGTGDGGSDRIFLEMDLVRGWVLGSVRIPSESEEYMTPHLKLLKSRLGLPLAGVCDMYSSMINVLTNVMSGVSLRLCHYHFLGDIGKDIMKDEYGSVRKLVIDTRLHTYLKRLRKVIYHQAEKDGIDIPKVARGLRSETVPSGISVDVCTKIQIYDTISWMLRYHEDNNGMRFPFSLPYLNFYERCKKGLETVTTIRKMAANGRISPKYLRDLESALRDSLEGLDSSGLALMRGSTTLNECFKLFEELRDILDIPKDKGDIPRDDLITHNNEIVAKMRTELEDFRERLREQASDGKHTKEKIIVDHLDKYWDKIILDNVIVKVEGEDVLIEIPRTSNGYETCFGMMKSDLRKRLGKKDIGHELNMYGDYLGYVQNLKSDSYVSLMFGSLDDLPDAFESIPPKMVRNEMELLRRRMIGYDITNNGSREKKVAIDDIMRGVGAVNQRLEEVLVEEIIRPPELFGQSNGLLTL